MVSAGAANKKAFGIDRTTNPWSDMVGTEVIWVAGSNVAECSPITTNYIWQARELGAKVIVQDPRITPLRADVRFVPPGQARARRGAVCRRAEPDDRTRLDRSRVHRRAHRRLRSGDGVLSRMGCGADRGGHRRARTPDPAGSGVLGNRAAPVSCSMRAASSTTRTASRTPWARSTWCWRPAASASPRADTARSSARATARAAANTGRNATSCPAGATSATPSIAATSPASGGSTRASCRDPASTPTRCSGKSTQARSRASSRSASTRRSRCPTTSSSRAVWTSSSSTSRSTSSSTRRRATPTSCCRAACTRRTRASSPRSRDA